MKNHKTISIIKTKKGLFTKYIVIIRNSNGEVLHRFTFRKRTDANSFYNYYVLNYIGKE